MSGRNSRPTTTVIGDPDLRVQHHSDTTDRRGRQPVGNGEVVANPDHRDPRSSYTKSEPVASERNNTVKIMARLKLNVNNRPTGPTSSAMSGNVAAPRSTTAANVLAYQSTADRLSPDAFPLRFMLIVLDSATEVALYVLE